MEMEFKPLLAGISLQSAGGGVIWVVNRLLLQYPPLPVSSLGYQPSILPFLIPIFAGSFVAAFLTDIETPVYGAIVGIISALIGGVGVSLLVGAEAGVMEGLYYEAGVQIQGFSLFYSFLFFLQMFPRQLGVGFLIGPAAGLVGGLVRSWRPRKLVDELLA